MPTKKCVACKEIKDHGLFRNNRAMRDGKSQYCKTCHLIKDRERIERKVARGDPMRCSVCCEEKPPAEFALTKGRPRKQKCAGCINKQKYQARIRQANDSGTTVHGILRTSPGFWANQLIRNARVRGKYEVAVTPEDLREIYTKTDGHCPITNVKMTINTDRPDSVSLDRINNNLGYTADNVRLVCRWVNIAKFTMTDAELMDWCRAVLTNGYSAYAVGDSQ